MRIRGKPAERATQLIGLLALAIAAAFVSPVRAAETDCLDTDAALNYWRPIREQAAASELPANELALELVSCLGSPNPELRDGIGYELFTSWLRNGNLDDATRRKLLNELSSGLGDVSESAGLKRSF